MGTPHAGDKGGAHAGGDGQRDVHPTEGQTDEEPSGDVGAHGGVTPRGTAGREEAQLGDTQRQDGDTPETEW